MLGFPKISIFLENGWIFFFFFFFFFFVLSDLHGYIVGVDKRDEIRL